MRTKELIAYRHHTCVVPFQDDSSMCFLLLKPGISSCNSISLWTYFNSGFHPSHSILNAQFTIFTLPRKTIGSPSQNTQLIYLKLSWSLLVFLPISSGTGLQLSIFFFYGSFFAQISYHPSSLPTASESSCHLSYAGCFKKMSFPAHSFIHMLPKLLKMW